MLHSQSFRRTDDHSDIQYNRTLTHAVFPNSVPFWCMLDHNLLAYKCIFLSFVFVRREEMERFVDNGTLSHLKVCFSRADMEENGSEPRPKYVQHNLRLYAKHVAQILLKENGCLYVCGWVGQILFDLRIKDEY